jgi:hypothetical protein
MPFRFREGNGLIRAVEAFPNSNLEFLNSVILKPLFWAKDLPRCLNLERRQSGFSTMHPAVRGEKAKATAIKPSTSREILRATEALQDDRFYMVSNLSVTTVEKAA